MDGGLFRSGWTTPGCTSPASGDWEGTQTRMCLREQWSVVDTVFLSNFCRGPGPGLPWSSLLRRVRTTFSFGDSRGPGSRHTETGPSSARVPVSPGRTTL